MTPSTPPSEVRVTRLTRATPVETTQLNMEGTCAHCTRPIVWSRRWVHTDSNLVVCQARI